MMPTTNLSGFLFRATTAHELKIKVLRDNRLQYLCVCGIKRKSRFGIMEHCAAKKLEGEERLSFDPATGASPSRREVWPDDSDIADNRPLNMVSNPTVAWDPADYSIDPNVVVETGSIAPQMSTSWRVELMRLMTETDHLRRVQRERERTGGLRSFSQWADEGIPPVSEWE